MSFIRLVRVLGVACFMLSMTAPAFAQEEPGATVTVVHAVQRADGFPADLYLNGQIVVESMVFDAVSEPLQLPAGTVEVALYEAGSDPGSTEPLLAQPVTLEAGASYTIVAQVVDSGLAMALYINDLDPVDTGETRVTIRHSGLSGPLAFAVGDEPVVGDLMSPNEVTVVVPSGTYPLSVSSEDGATLFEQDLDLRAGSLVVLYAVGAADSEFDLLTQQVIIPQVSPTGVPTGTGGLRASSGGALWLLVPVGVVVLALVAVRPRRATAG